MISPVCARNGCVGKWQERHAESTCAAQVLEGKAQRKKKPNKKWMVHSELCHPCQIDCRCFCGLAAVGMMQNYRMRLKSRQRIPRMWSIAATFNHIRFFIKPHPNQKQKSRANSTNPESLHQSQKNTTSRSTKFLKPSQRRSLNRLDA